MPTSSILVGRCGLAAPILSEKIHRKAAKVAKERGGESDWRAQEEAASLNPNSKVEMQTKRFLTTDYTDCTDKEKSQKMRSSIISKSAKSVVEMIRMIFRLRISG